MSEVPETAAAILREAGTIAVLGMKGEEAGNEPAYTVPTYLREEGYRIIPVNPKLAAAGVPDAVGSLAEITEPVDLVEVFRRPDAIDAHVDELLALKPKAVWFQLGIRNDAVAKRLEDAGIRVVQDRCMFRDHHALKSSGAL